jgi:putative hydrolase of the HAD superfamily
MRYDAVIFDLFGTLVPFPGSEDETAMLGRVATTLGVDYQQFLLYWREYLPAREAGRLGTLAENFEHACRTLGVAVDPTRIAKADKIKHHQVEAYLRIVPESEGALIRVRRAGLLVGLISNGPPETAGVWPSTAWAPLVDQAVFSAAVGMLKPDPAIYMHACELLGVAPERCLYVGDGGSRELTGATGVGMDAVLVRGNVENNGFYADQLDDAHDWQGPLVASVAEIPGMIQG